MQDVVSEKLTQESFEQSFHRYEKKLCRIAYSYLRDQDAARDAVNEIFTAAWRHREYIEIKTFGNQNIRSIFIPVGKKRVLEISTEQET